MDWKYPLERSSLLISPSDLLLTSTEELKSKVACAVVVSSLNVNSDVIAALIDHHSSFYSVGGIIGRIYRFYNNAIGHNHITTAQLSTNELKNAELHVVRHLQEMQFADDLKQLRLGKLVQRGSPLQTLSPFLDNEGVLRVGGRLSRSLLPYEEKHPIIIKFHPIIRSVIEHHHLAVCHSGPVLTLGNLRKRFWLLN